MDHQAASERPGNLPAYDGASALPVSPNVQDSLIIANALEHSVKLKPMELAYGIEAVFKDHLPKLQHGNDGLIFTGAEAPYTVGTDERM